MLPVPSPAANVTVKLSASAGASCAVHLALSVMSALMAEAKSNAASSGVRQESKVKPSFVGSAGFVAVPPAVTVWASTALPPSLSKVTVKVAGLFSIHFALSLVSALIAELKSNSVPSSVCQ